MRIRAFLKRSEASLSLLVFLLCAPTCYSTNVISSFEKYAVAPLDSRNIDSSTARRREEFFMPNFSIETPQRLLLAKRTPTTIHRHKAVPPAASWIGPTFQKHFEHLREQAARGNNLEQELAYAVHKNAKSKFRGQESFSHNNIIKDIELFPPQPAKLKDMLPGKALGQMIRQNRQQNNLIASEKPPSTNLKNNISLLRRSNPETQEIFYANGKSVQKPSNNLPTDKNNKRTVQQQQGFRQSPPLVLKDLTKKKLLLHDTPEEDDADASNLFDYGPFPHFRTRSPAVRFLNSLSNQIIYDNWWLQWERAPSSRFTSLLLANNYGFGSAGIGIRDGTTDVTAQWRDIVVSEYTSRANSELAVGFARGRWGLFGDVSKEHRAITAELLGRFFEVSTLADLYDRDYGFRIRIRNLDIAIRHDLDEYRIPNEETYATQFLVAYGGLAIVGGIDIPDATYAVGLGYRGNAITLQHDFDDRKTNLDFDFGRAWGLSLETDFIDSKSQQLYARLGFGRLAHAHVGAGAGISDEGIPLAFLGLQLPDNLIQFQFTSGSDNSYSFQYSVTIGKLTYVWKSNIVPQNFRIPNFLGLSPKRIQNFLLRQEQNL